MPDLPGAILSNSIDRELLARPDYHPPRHVVPCTARSRRALRYEASSRLSQGMEVHLITRPSQHRLIRIPRNST
jgi:hypothetical protein